MSLESSRIRGGTSLKETRGQSRAIGGSPFKSTHDYELKHSSSVCRLAREVGDLTQGFVDYKLRVCHFAVERKDGRIKHKTGIGLEKKAESEAEPNAVWSSKEGCWRDKETKEKGLK